MLSLTPADRAVLQAMATNGKTRQAISARSGYAPATVTHSLHRLQSEGLVRETTSPAPGVSGRWRKRWRLI